MLKWPICAWKVLWQCGQWMGATCVVGESLALGFLACLRCFAAAVLFVSQVAAPLYREERHPARS